MSRRHLVADMIAVGIEAGMMVVDADDTGIAVAGVEKEEVMGCQAQYP